MYKNDKLTTISDSASGDKLRTLIINQENGTTQSIIEQKYKKTTAEETIKQRRFLMRKIDNSMYKRLKNIKKLFTTSEVSTR